MINWIEVLSTDSDRLVALAKEYQVHPLAIEDCQHRDQRPKLDDYGTHQLLVWFMVTKNKPYELQFLIFADKIVFVPHLPPPDGGTWKEYFRLSEDQKDIWHALYFVLDRATDITWQELRKIFSKVDDFEVEIFKSDINIQNILSLKKKLNRSVYYMGHLASVAEQLQNFYKPIDDLNWKFRDLHDHCERIYQNVAFYRSQIATTIDLYWGLESNRTNNQIKKLSLLASVAVPLTFWASFWGMNFKFIPYDEPWMFFVAMGLMISSVALTMWLLVKKGYWTSEGDKK